MSGSLTLDASGRMAAWFLAAILICILFPAAPPLFQMCSPAWFDPTNDRALTSAGVQVRKAS